MVGGSQTMVGGSQTMWKSKRNLSRKVFKQKEPRCHPIVTVGVKYYYVQAWIMLIVEKMFLEN